MLSILIGLILLIALAYLGWSIIWVAPLAAGVVALLSGLDVYSTYTETYMSGLVSFVQKWFPIFLLGAVFGKLMEETGAARAVAQKVTQLIGGKRAILGVLIAAALLTYGGVSLFVVVFAVYPIALELFREANVTRRLLVPTFALGAFTFTMTSMPGTPQIQNLIPMDTYNTTPMAGPVIGIVTTLIMAVGGYAWLAYREKKLSAKGEGFEIRKQAGASKEEEVATPNWMLSLVPLIVVVVFLNIVNLQPIYALMLGIVTIMLINVKHYKRFVFSINEGAKGSVMAILNTSAAVGFGAVIAIVPAFDNITSWLLNVSDNPLVAQSLAIQVMAMITGSASGGMGIALSTLGDTFYNLSQTTGINPEVFHRMASVASGASILPNNGALLTLLAVTGLSHRETYKDVFVVALVIPTIAVIVGIILGGIGLV
ncbi:GntP family permease [Planococcus sp. CP5-4]|uniref:GntP family permease n=1 Tax=unclassified Planococcus (in: firmicutes) TaxID=2662419 RepID=UPI001C24BF81|nr:MULTISPECIES: GntP family permease [unclassified Planococcus (in: firmicutes)]MBU9673814.1 GntP family permease [Planococcus sp. CP5-4_YE]MBV0908942.1 GntP family permease [Planococcus sp. CP5-4_UN]MBW6063991.1 GntP family permease [Planococcus sp. CP5-4]